MNRRLASARVFALSSHASVALEASDGPLRDAFRDCVANEIGDVEKIVPSNPETAEIAPNFLCVRAGTIYATDVGKKRAKTRPVPIEFFKQINQKTDFLKRGVVKYALIARQNRIGKQKEPAMCVLANKPNRVIRQRLTGIQRTFHTEPAIAYGTGKARGAPPLNLSRM